MRASEFLFEYKRDITLRNYREKLFKRIADDRRTTATGGSLYDLWHKRNENGTNDRLEAAITSKLNTHLARIEAADPTPHKQYTQWLVRKYIDGTFNYFEDVLSEGESFVTMWHYLKTHRALPHVYRDINQIKNKFDYRNAFNTIKSAYEDYKGKETLENKGQAKEIYNDSQIRVIVPLDEEASCYYGQGTRWCTASTTSNNYFDDYNDRGHLYIVIPKNPEYRDEKYQLHLADDMYTDEQDEEISELKLIQRWPQLHKLLHDDAKSYNSDSMFSIDFNTISNVDQLPTVVKKIFSEWTKPEYINKWIDTRYLLDRISRYATDEKAEQEQMEYVKQLQTRLHDSAIFIFYDVKDVLSRYNNDLTVFLGRSSNVQLSSKIKKLTKLLLQPVKPQSPNGGFDITPDMSITEMEKGIAEQYAGMVWTELDTLITKIISSNVFGKTDEETAYNVDKFIGANQVKWDVGY